MASSTPSVTAGHLTAERLPLRSATDYHPPTITAGVRMSTAQATGSTSSVGNRRKAAASALAAFACAPALTAVSAAQAQAPAFPDRPLRVVVPFAPGGGTDNLIRVIAPSVGASLGQQLVIENRPGGGSNIGTEIVAKAPGDGYTVLVTDLAFVVNPGLFKSKMPLDTVKSFTGVSMLATAPVLLVTHPSVPAKDLKELLALARVKPGSLDYASGGVGASTHLAGELLKQAAKVFIVHIPYKGTGQSVGDLVAGHIHFVFASMPVVMPQMKAGRLRALAVTGAQRTPQAPDLPTVAEAGIPGYAFDTWWSLLAPAGTSGATLNLLNSEVRRILALPEVRQRFAELGIDVLPSSPGELAEFTRSEIERLAKIIRQTGLKAE